MGTMKDYLIQNFARALEKERKLAKKGLCVNCGKHKGTENWVGQGSTMDFIHGNYQQWCKKCTLEAQLTYAIKHQNDVKKIREKLEKLKL